MLIRMLALAAFAPLMLLAACGGDDTATTTPKASSQTATTQATATHAATATVANSQTVAPVGTNPASAMDITITAADFSLTPATIAAKAGQVVNITFKNTGTVEHSFTVGTTDVTESEGGGSSSGTFTASASTLEFHCKYHPTVMKGTITIS